jgi:hypothetical protein
MSLQPSEMKQIDSGGFGTVRRHRHFQQGVAIQTASRSSSEWFVSTIPRVSKLCGIGIDSSRELVWWSSIINFARPEARTRTVRIDLVDLGYNDGV